MSEGDPEPDAGDDEDAPISDDDGGEVPSSDDAGEDTPIDEDSGTGGPASDTSGGDDSATHAEDDDTDGGDFREAHFDERARANTEFTAEAASESGEGENDDPSAPEENADGDSAGGDADAGDDTEDDDSAGDDADAGDDTDEADDSASGGGGDTDEDSEDDDAPGETTGDIPVGAGTAAPEPDSPEPVATGFGEEGAPDDQEMPLAVHIEEMVKRLAVVIVILALVSAVVLPLADRFINFLWYSFLPGPPTECVQAAAFPVNGTGAGTLVDVTNATVTNVTSSGSLNGTSARLLAGPNATLANASAGTVVDLSNAALLGTNTTGALADVGNATLAAAHNATLVDVTNGTLLNATGVNIPNATAGSTAMGGNSEAACPRLYHPLALVFARLKMASLAGFVIALPAFVYETYLFMRPGLYPNERRYYLASVPTSLILAGIGLAFAYFLVLPVIFVYFLGYSQPVAEVAFGLTKTFNLILLMLGMFALIFQIPLFIMLAIMMGVTSRRWLEGRRLYFWFGFAGIAFIFSPDPTGMAPFIVAATMVVLFEGTLLLLRWTGR